MNTQSYEWQISDGQNCLILGGEAIKYLKRGMKVARKGWNGKRQYISACNSDLLQST